MKISKALDIRLTVPLTTLLKLSGELLFDGFRTVPCLQPLSVDLILDLNISQRGERGLKFGCKIIRIPRGLCRRHKRSWRGRATRHQVALPILGSRDHSTIEIIRKANVAPGDSAWLISIAPVAGMAAILD
jgi:hypothetical protein